MVAILACAFPALLLLTIVALVPIRVPQPKPVAAGHPREPSRLSFAQSMGQRVVYLAVSFSLAVPITWAQFRLFELASLKSTDLDFAFRATDSLVVSILPSLPIGMLVSVPLLYRMYLWQQGERFLEELDRIPAVWTKPKQLIGFPRYAAVFALLATLLNVATFDTYIAVRGGAIAYSGFLSPRTRVIPVRDVARLDLYSQRRGRYGVENFPLLEGWLTDGSQLGILHNLERRDIPPFIDALQRNAASPIPVRTIAGPPR